MACSDIASLNIGKPPESNASVIRDYFAVLFCHGKQEPITVVIKWLTYIVYFILFFIKGGVL